MGGDWALDRNCGEVESVALGFYGYGATLVQSVLSAGTYDFSGYTANTTYGTGPSEALWAPAAGTSATNLYFTATGINGTATNIRIQAASGDNYLQFQQAGGSLQSVTFRAVDSKEFKLTSLDWRNVTGVSTSTVTFTGYRDATLIGPTTATWQREHLQQEFRHLVRKHRQNHHHRSSERHPPR